MEQRFYSTSDNPLELSILIDFTIRYVKDADLSTGSVERICGDSIHDRESRGP